jgi:hypothetical protein
MDTCEGILISSSAAVSVCCGFHIDYCVQTSVINCHVNTNPSGGTVVACIYSSGTGAAARVDQCFFIGNLLYPGQASTKGVLGCFQDCVFSGNMINGEAAGNTGIIGMDITGNSNALSILGNIVFGCGSTGIQLSSGTTVARGVNVFRSNGTNVNDLNGGNTVT